jgi:hypothetical protein
MKKMANEFQNALANDTPPKEASPKMTHLLTQHLSVPKTGGLTPNPAIQQRVRNRLKPRKNMRQNLHHIIRFRIPIYQAAFGMAMACFIVLASTHIFSSHTTQIAPNPKPDLGLLDSTAILGALSKEVLRTTSSDSLGVFRFEMPDTFSSARVDTL